MADFGLFEGGVTNAPSSATTTANQTPQWYQDLSYEQMMKARTVGSRPYETYALPTVAEATPDQQAAYQGVRQNVGAWQPSYDVAMKGFQSLGGADPGVQSGIGYMQAAAGYNPMLSQQPYLNSAVGRINEGQQGAAASLAEDQRQYLRPDLANAGLDQGQQTYSRAGALDSVGASQPYFGQAAGATQQAISERALAAAQPYLQSAGGNAAGGTDQYMNQYNSAVTDQIARLGARNLRENLLPALGDQFVAAGQFGGSRMGEFGQRALRDTQESVLAQQAQALQQGYGQALAASQADLARQATLAGTAGSIAGADLSRTLQGAGQYSSMGQAAGQLTQGQQQNLAALANLSWQAGAGQQQTGLSALGQVQQAEQADMARKLQAASQLASIGGQQASATGQYSGQLMNIGSGIAGASSGDASRQQSALQALANAGQTQQGLIASDSAALEAIGQSQQELQQRQLDAAYRDYVAQQQYPQTQLDWYQAQLRNTGQYLPNTTTQNATTPIATPSPLSQLAGLYTIGRGITTP